MIKANEPNFVDDVNIVVVVSTTRLINDDIFDRDELNSFNTVMRKIFLNVETILTIHRN